MCRAILISASLSLAMAVFSSCATLMTEAFTSKEEKRLFADQKERFRTADQNTENNLKLLVSSDYSGDICIDGKPVSQVLDRFDVIEGVVDIYFTTYYVGHLSAGRHYLIEERGRSELCREIVVSTSRTTVALGKRQGIVSQSIRESASEFNEEYGDSPYFEKVVGDRSTFVIRQLAASDSEDDIPSLLGIFKIISDAYPELSSEYDKLQHMAEIWDCFNRCRKGELTAAELQGRVAVILAEFVSEKTAY